MKQFHLQLATAPYPDNAAHLRDELARVDLLVRAQVTRWRLTIGESKPEGLWGMIHVSEAEIDQYVSTEVLPPDMIPRAVLDTLGHFWQAELEVGVRIRHWVDATDSDVDLRVERLRAQFALSGAELDIILLCLLPEIDLRYRRIFGYLQDDASRSYPPIDLLGQMVHPKAPTLEDKHHLFDPSVRLLRWRLIHLTNEVEGGVGRAVRIDERIASFLLGRDHTDHRLEHVLRPMPAGGAWERLHAAPATLAALREFAALPDPPSVVVLHGTVGSGRAKAARAVCQSRGLGLLHFHVERALREPLAWNTLLDLAYREALLQNTALYFDGVECLEADDRPVHLSEDLAHMAERMPLLTFLATESAGEGTHFARQSRYPRFDFPVPHYDLRRAIWLGVLQDSASQPSREALAEQLAAAFQLNEGQIVSAAAAAEALAQRRSFAHPKPTLHDFYEACRRQSGRRLLGFASRIEPTRGLTLDHVILTEANKLQLRELMDRVRLRSRLDQQAIIGPAISRGKGLLALFAGPSGTGKTLAAEAIAAQQGMDLYKIDVSTVVSKWLGETEKNLSRVFADAEGSDALLFFDECDSLFGQRGQINEAHDRWANLQTNYLLQRVEEYSGVVILATNLRKNIDDAFLRRIQVIVEFPTPDAALRFAIWQRSVVPAANGLAEAELRQVADRFSLSGGSIRNVAIEAAYRALARDRIKIELRDVIDSIAREYQKLGRPITQGDFGEQFYRWVQADVMAPRPPG